ncbi:MAG: SUMF1/EgtB/PvdO family nonheme iron enzyme [Verrucomicrobia bacterium]|nr:SUMF1/EgtB/PvdO family nonheme iron enzyme [Verrucomicrobiota bacterium]
MKDPFRLLLLASAFASLINSSFGATIQFTDSNFEAQIRSKVERGWYYVPGYTGKDYQFKTEDFEYRISLDFDSDGPQINSLADLQHFPNLTSLCIWDAFKISDFSPIWNLKDKLEYLAINGSRNADLSGVAEMSKLRSLDLDDNQLSNLSILGNYPNLMELLLVGNYLDLSDAGIKATLSNFSNLIQTNRANQGWWWGSVIELEPQLPKSFQNLTSEMARVQNANDPQSNFLKGIHALLHIVESTEANSLKEFVVSIGVDSSIRQFTLSDLPMLENYSHTLNRDFNSGKLAELFQNSIIPSLEQVDSHFAKIPSGSVIILTQDLTGTEEPVTVDYADVLVLRSIVKLMATFASMQSAYDWDLNAGFIDDLEDNPDPNVEVTTETLRTHNSNFGGIRNAGQLAKAKQFLESAISTYKLASPLLIADSRLDKSIPNGTPAPDRLFVLPIHDLDDEQEFRDALDEFQKALNAPYELKDDDWNDPDLVFNTEDDDIIAESETIDLSRFFAGKVDLASLLPASKGNDFTTDIVTDPTMGGLFPQFTQARVTSELLEAKLVPGKFEVTITVVGSGTVTGAGVYSEGSFVGLSATPSAGYVFTGWSGGASGGNNPLTLHAYAYSQKNLVANFGKVAASSQWMWHGAFPWVYSYAENSWWYMKAGTDGKFRAWKQGDKKWYSFDEASQSWIVISGQGSEENKAGDTFTVLDLSLEMLWVEPGAFDMGSPTSEPNRRSDETQHQVTLTNGFWLGKHEVTQAQWEQVMGSNPSNFKGANRPVETVSWNDVTSFCEKLTEQERTAGRLPVGMAYQLPTEAQWEYACRAGTTTAYSWGNGITASNANYAYDGWGTGLQRTSDVGQYAANPWGFHDMHGNAFEWCADWYGNYPTGAVRDPVGPADGSDRVSRGGSWDYTANFARSAYRNWYVPADSNNALGVRLSLRPASK